MRWGTIEVNLSHVTGVLVKKNKNEEKLKILFMGFVYYLNF